MEFSLEEILANTNSYFFYKNENAQDEKFRVSTAILNDSGKYIYIGSEIEKAVEAGASGILCSEGDFLQPAYQKRIFDLINKYKTAIDCVMFTKNLNTALSELSNYVRFTRYNNTKVIVSAASVGDITLKVLYSILKQSHYVEFNPPYLFETPLAPDFILYECTGRSKEFFKFASDEILPDIAIIGSGDVSDKEKLSIMHGMSKSALAFLNVDKLNSNSKDGYPCKKSYFFGEDLKINPLQGFEYKDVVYKFSNSDSKSAKQAAFAVEVALYLGVSAQDIKLGTVDVNLGLKKSKYSEIEENSSTNVQVKSCCKKLLLTLDTVIKKINAYPLILSDKNTVFEFTCANLLETDYIFIPLSDNKVEIIPSIMPHLENPNCKGFLIPEELIKKRGFRTGFLKLLSLYSPKNVLVVKNVYNAAFKIAKAILDNSNSNVIVLAGEETQKEKTLLGSALKVDSSSFENSWQRMLEPIFKTSTKTIHTILEIDFKKARTASLIAGLARNYSVIFTKITQDMYDEAKNLLSGSLKSAFIINGGKFPIESKVQEREKLEEVISEIIPNKKESGISIAIDNTGDFEEILKSIKKLISENKDKKKLVILSKMPNSDKLANRIAESLTGEIDFVVLVGRNELAPVIWRNCPNILIRRINCAQGSEILQIKKFLNYCKKFGDISGLAVSESGELWNLV